MGNEKQSMCQSDVLLHPRTLIQHEFIQQHRLRRMATELAAGRDFVPIDIMTLSDGGYLVVDGAHRSAAAALLGWSQVPCRMVELNSERAIHGWTHVVRGVRLSAFTELNAAAAGGGPQVAEFDLWGQRWPVHAPDTSQESVFRTYHRVGSWYQHLRYERQESPAPGAWCQVTWLVPGWERLSDLLQRHGPLPSSVVRFESHRVEMLPIAA